MAWLQRVFHLPVRESSIGLVLMFCVTREEESSEHRRLHLLNLDTISKVICEDFICNL